MCFITNFLLCLTLFIVGKCQDPLIDDKICPTPDGNVGHCIPVRQCQSIMNYLLTVNRPLSIHDRKQLHGYTCSSTNKTVYVCCPQGPINKISFERNESPPNVLNHTNLHLLPTECGHINLDEGRVWHGRKEEKNQYPWMALLSYKTKKGPVFKCGGTIINDRYILTVAHCATNQDVHGPLLGARIGYYNTPIKQKCTQQENGTMLCTEGYQDLLVEAVIPHPQFNASIIANDIGLIRVSKMNLNLENAQPVCLPTEDFGNETLKNLLATTWDLLNGKTEEGPFILEEFVEQLVELEQCGYLYKNVSRVHLTSRQLCANASNYFCPGSSGGSLQQATLVKYIARYIQLGVLSSGSRGCGSYPNVYTRVAYYMDWILDTIRP